MKKQIILVLMMFYIGILYSASITVTNPGGAAIVKGNTVVITWNAVGTTKGFKITLWKDSALVNVIEANFAAGNGNRTYQWLVPNTCGIGYQIKIKEKTTPVAAMSGNFKITGCIKPEFKKPIPFKRLYSYYKNLKITINVFKPINNGSYEVGKVMQIQWNKNIGNSGKVKIILCNVYPNAWKYAETVQDTYPNRGLAAWTPKKKYAWPGTKLMIMVIAKDNSEIYGKSGVFTVFNPKPAKPPANPVIARTPIINNKKTFKNNSYPAKECLSVPIIHPGRVSGSKELKTGHFIKSGKHGKCYFGVEYFFSSSLNFDLSKIKGKEIIRAELMLSLSDEIMQGPTGTLGTNEFCNSESRIFEGGNLIKTFSIFEEGKHLKIDILNSIKNWAISNQLGTYSIVIKGKMDSVPNANSVCLRYYKGIILLVEYKN